MKRINLSCDSKSSNRTLYQVLSSQFLETNFSACYYACVAYTHARLIKDYNI